MATDTPIAIAVTVATASTLRIMLQSPLRLAGGAAWLLAEIVPSRRPIESDPKKLEREYNPTNPKL
jgi:hypothetical protein